MGSWEINSWIATNLTGVFKFDKVCFAKCILSDYLIAPKFPSSYNGMLI